MGAREGIRLAIAYSRKPNERGFCGPQEDEAKLLLKGFLFGENEEEGRVRQILSGFEGAFAYYKLIASKNGIEDPFDERVVEAYWIGNELLENVASSDIKEMIRRDFVGKSRLTARMAEELAARIPFGVKAHHSTHVFHVGSVTGRLVLKGRLLDMCRVCSGQVGDIEDDRMEVFYKPTVITEKGAGFGTYKKDYVHYDRRLFPHVKRDDVISFHWQEACQVLSKKQAENLNKYTRHTLSLL